MPTITVRGDIAEGLQPPDVSTAIWKELQPLIARLPAGYRIEQGGSIEESGKANRALAPLFPIMIALTLITIVVQVRSISMMTMVFATAPLGLIGVIPTLLLFKQPIGINALVGLIALSGILMRNTLILIGQIRHNEKDGLAPFDAVVEATVAVLVMFEVRLGFTLTTSCTLVDPPEASTPRFHVTSPVPAL